MTGRSGCLDLHCTTWEVTDMLRLCTIVGTWCRCQVTTTAVAAAAATTTLAATVGWEAASFFFSFIHPCWSARCTTLRWHRLSLLLRRLRLLRSALAHLCDGGLLRLISFVPCSFLRPVLAFGWRSIDTPTNNSHGRDPGMYSQSAGGCTTGCGGKGFCAEVRHCISAWVAEEPQAERWQH